jgi:hypothetical protein
MMEEIEGEIEAEENVQGDKVCVQELQVQG